MSSKVLESVYEASARLNISSATLIGIKSFSDLVPQGKQNGLPLFSQKQMNYIASNVSKQSKLPALKLEVKAQIIELFICEKNNQIERIAKITGIKSHRVRRIVEEHMNSLWSSKYYNDTDEFLILKSKINK